MLDLELSLALAKRLGWNKVLSQYAIPMIEQIVRNFATRWSVCFSDVLSLNNAAKELLSTTHKISDYIFSPMVDDALLLGVDIYGEEIVDGVLTSDEVDELCQFGNLVDEYYYLVDEDYEIPRTLTEWDWLFHPVCTVANFFLIEKEAFHWCSLLNHRYMSRSPWSVRYSADRYYHKTIN